jgi:hypothetical protein
MENNIKSTDARKYTSRERVLTAIDHKEPDRVPKDMGGAIMTGIMAHALDRLRKYLGLPRRKVKVFEVFQMLGEVEMDVIDRFRLDVMPVYPPVQFFGLEKKNYKPWKLWDGTEVLVPGQFDVETDRDGGWLLREGGDPRKPVEGKMPKNGFYFDMPSISTFEEDYTPPDLEEIKGENHLQPDELEYMAERAGVLRARTDKALLLDQWSKVGVTWVGSIPNFLMLLYTDKEYVKDLFKIRTETSIKNFEKIKEYIGDNIDILGLDGHDYGAQDRELLSPQVFE